MENTLLQKKEKRTIRSILHDFFGYPLSLLSHPIGNWEEFEGKMSVAVTYFVLMIFAVIVQTVATGFLLNPTPPTNFNIFLTASKVILPVLVGTIANWCITALFDGKGTMKSIFITICYSFFPFVWLTFLATLLSNFVVENEVSYIHLLTSLAALLTGYMLFFGLKGIHKFGLFKNIGMILFTIVAIAIILFIALLFLSFIQQIVQWIFAVVKEIRLRYF